MYAIRSYYEAIVSMVALGCGVGLVPDAVIDHSPIYYKLQEENRILHYNWLDYNAGNVVFKPKQMSPEKLQEMYSYAWDTFYKDEPQRLKMAKS